jgi:hypothetical protein
VRTDTSEVSNTDRPPLLPEGAGVWLLSEALENRRERRVRLVNDPVLIDPRLPLGDRGARRFDTLDQILVLNTVVATPGECYRAAFGRHPAHKGAAARPDSPRRGRSTRAPAHQRRTRILRT